jgi:hypothetical protein
MQAFNSWETHAESWLALDHKLLTCDEGWTACKPRHGVELWRRTTDDDPNHLFRWRIGVDAPAETVHAGFVVRVLEYHQHWTREFAGGHVVEDLDAARVLYQRFQPGIPWVSLRDLCSIEIPRRLDDGTILVSFRSVDAVPPSPGHVRIDWWGAALIRPIDGGKRCELTYLDRENQGGLVPAWSMNLSMPKFLFYQAEQVQRFFVGGGPPELSRPGPSSDPG